MGIRNIFLVIVYLTSYIYCATTQHEPQVHEDLDESPPEYKRPARHLDGFQKSYEPPIFNYRKAMQQDHLKSRYHRQQQADSRNLKFGPESPDIIRGLHKNLGQNRGPPMSISFQDNDWKPFQPRFLNPIKAGPVSQKKNEAISFSKQSDIVREDIHENDLDIAGSEPQEHAVKTDRHDKSPEYIYVAPSLLKNNFGLDSKTTQKILRNSAPETVEANPDTFQISELQELLGKNPDLQLEGLQKLLEEAQPIMQGNQKESQSIQIEHNGSPSLSSASSHLESLQQQIDAVNKAQEEQVLAAAQKQAEAHVQAQHKALALAQQQAQDEAYAKIAAHNQGLSSPSDHLEVTQGDKAFTDAPRVVQNYQIAEESAPHAKPQEDAQENNQNSIELNQHGFNLETPEVSALQGRPAEQLLVQPSREYGKTYASTAQDLRNVKPRIQGARGRFYRPVSLAKPESLNPKLQYQVSEPSLFDTQDLHNNNYSPVSPYIPHFDPHQNEVEVAKNIPQSTKLTTVHLPALQEHQHGVQHSYEHVEPPSPHGQILHSKKHESHDDDHQYAAKYAFGYRIVDEQHGNDFGHEEARDGKLTKGHYYVTLPDGRKQRVEYYADNSGYHARVSYEHVGTHPHVNRHTNSADRPEHPGYPEASHK